MALISYAKYHVPDDFPINFYEDVYLRLMGYRNSRRIELGELKALNCEWTEFQGGWNALAKRFRACAEHDECFRRLVNEHGTSPPPEPIRYEQERELFEFFVTGLTAIECCFYGLYHIGMMTNPSVFNDDPEYITPGNTESKYRSRDGFPKEPITTALGTLIRDPKFKEWKRIRNILSHRSLPGRIFHETDLMRQTTWFEKRHGIKITIDLETTLSRRAWLVSRLDEILSAASELAQQQGWPRSELQ